jgi:hypothetical protein
MPDQDNNKDCSKTPAHKSTSDPHHPAGMTLDDVIDVTGELEHLNELVLLSLEKSGGFSCTESYFSVVQPLLDLLEVELRIRCTSGMTQQQVKLIIQDWIDEEIADLRRAGRT